MLGILRNASFVIRKFSRLRFHRDSSRVAPEQVSGRKYGPEYTFGAHCGFPSRVLSPSPVFSPPPPVLPSVGFSPSVVSSVLDPPERPPDPAGSANGSSLRFGGW